jgi:ribonuclease P protein component
VANPMISRKFRLPYSEFSKHGYQTTKTPYFSLKIKKNNLPYNRIGVIIGTTVAKSAVRRNFWKRQVKSILIKQPIDRTDFVVIFSKKIKEVSRGEFRKELLKVLTFPNH